MTRQHNILHKFDILTSTVIAYYLYSQEVRCYQELLKNLFLLCFREHQESLKVKKVTNIKRGVM